MEVFLEKVHQLLPVLGIELLVPKARKPPPTMPQKELICRIKGLEARGYLVPNGILVLEGSEAVKQDRPSTAKWPQPKIVRLRLLEAGTLVDKGDKLVFTADAEFSSPSAAAAVIRGGSSNGLTTWKDSVGRTLKEIQDQ
jgi:hypothetical protein